MDLKGGEPLWPLLALVPLVCGAMGANERCDALVIGSGITGALTAFHLADAGLDVVVIDRRGVARGSTPASTALLQYDIDTPLIDLRGLVGADWANCSYRASRGALDDMAALVERLAIECDLSQRQSLYLAQNEKDVSRLREECAARAEIGLEVGYLDNSALGEQFGIKRPGGILSAFALQCNPLKLTHELLRRAHARGARIYEHTELAESPSIMAGQRIFTTCGQWIDAAHIVFATGYEAPEEFPELKSLCKLHSTFALATKPIDPSSLWAGGALIWEMADPYLYARATTDGRVIIGGADEPFKNAMLRDKLIAGKTRTLLKKFKSVYDLKGVEVETAWAGTFGQTEDSLPYVGEMKEYPRCHFALGYGGNGITFSLIAAQIIRDGILGKPNPSAPLFSFARRK